MIKWKSWKNYPLEKGTYLVQIRCTKIYEMNPVDAGLPYEGVFVCAAHLRDEDSAWGEILPNSAKNGLAWFVNDLYKMTFVGDPRLKLMAWAPLSELDIPEFYSDSPYPGVHKGCLDIRR